MLLERSYSHSLSLITGANGSGVRPGAGRRKQTQETAEGSEAWPHLGVILTRVIQMLSSRRMLQDFGLKEGLPGTPFHRGMQARNAIEAKLYAKIKPVIDNPARFDGQRSLVLRLYEAFMEDAEASGETMSNECAPASPPNCSCQPLLTRTCHGTHSTLGVALLLEMEKRHNACVPPQPIHGGTLVQGGGPGACAGRVFPDFCGHRHDVVQPHALRAVPRSEPRMVPEAQGRAGRPPRRVRRHHRPQGAHPDHQLPCIRVPLHAWSTCILMEPDCEAHRSVRDVSNAREVGAREVYMHGTGHVCLVTHVRSRMRGP